MPDTVSPPSPERRSHGLPIPSTERLTADEREALRVLARLHRLAADRLDEAVAVGRVDRGLEALELCGTLEVPVEQATIRLGSNR
jgi:hypothetical protein